MKRFYCSICKRTIRVRKFPRNISTPDALAPENRVGECNWHSSIPTRASQHGVSSVSTSRKRA